MNCRSSLLTGIYLCFIATGAHARAYNNRYEDAQGAILKVQGGLGYSKMMWDAYGEQRYNHNLTRMCAGIGIDYCDRRRFNLSSNIVYVQKGGCMNDLHTVINGDVLKSSLLLLQYISVNTSFDYKLLADRIATPYLSLAPRVDYLVSYNKAILANLEAHNKLNRLTTGVNIGAGIKYSVDRIELGIRGDYLVNFSDLGAFTDEISGKRTPVRDKTFLFSLTCGFHLRNN